MKSAAKLFFMMSLALTGILIIVNPASTQERRMKLYVYKAELIGP